MATAARKLICVQHELAMRQVVYPRRIATRKMSRERAEREIELMREIVEDYTKLVEQERLL